VIVENPMDQETIRREVVRLAPWYYRFDFDGVRTDDLPACDPTGHRIVIFPAIDESFWTGKTILDVGCNEGAWSFGALDHGAASVVAFDCREVNIEKARFVARFRGEERVDFRVGSALDWVRRNPESYDVILLCGLLYHLPEPGKTIEEFCSIARESILVTSVLFGGQDGYTRYQEHDNVGASENAADSLMPNTTNTLVAEFAGHGFFPAHIEETRSGTFWKGFWGGCRLLLANGTAWPRLAPGAPEGTEPEAFAIHFVPERSDRSQDATRPVELQVVVYNQEARARRVNGFVTVRDSRGRTLANLGPEPLAFSPRVKDRGDRISHSLNFLVRFDRPVDGGDAVVEARLTDPESAEVVTTRSLRLP